MKDLIDYLVANSDTSSIYSGSWGDDESRLHASLLDRLTKDLRSIGIYSQPKHVFKEVALREEIIIGVVDLVVFDQPGELYLIEAKNIISPDKEATRVRNEIRKQLRRAYEFFKRKYNVTGTMIGAYQRRGQNRIDHFMIPKDLGDLLSTRINEE